MTLTTLIYRHLDVDVNNLDILQWLVKASCLSLLDHLHYISTLHHLHTHHLLIQVENAGPLARKLP